MLSKGSCNTNGKQFTMAYDFKIYTHGIHTEKGNHAGNQTIPVLNCTECVTIIEQFLTFYYYLSDQVIDICTLIWVSIVSVYSIRLDNITRDNHVTHVVKTCWRSEIIIII